MIKKNILIEYEEYSSIDQLPSDDKELLKNAIAATIGSYAPYSNFHVGAAVRLYDGTIIKGANQENAAYPSGLCAERTAIFAAHANYPELPIEAIAITGVIKDGSMMQPMPTYPCGACRQVMIESETRAGKPIRIIVGGEKAIHVFASVKSLLPFEFDNL